jgi:hypothetical protein
MSKRKLARKSLSVKSALWPEGSSCTLPGMQILPPGLYAKFAFWPEGKKYLLA